MKQCTKQFTKTVIIALLVIVTLSVSGCANIPTAAKLYGTAKDLNDKMVLDAEKIICVIVPETAIRRRYDTPTLYLAKRVICERPPNGTIQSKVN